MIYCCNKCSKTTFKVICDDCGENDYTMVPLDPSYYPDFHYESKGFLKDLFGKKKEQAQLNDLLERVLTKYDELLSPYFINYAHIILRENNNATDESEEGKSYSSSELFQEVLIRKGFDELTDKPDLLFKLLSTTVFSSVYLSFKKEMEKHVKDDFSNMLRSWIEESGTDFRKNLSLFMYYIWDNDIRFEDVNFSSGKERDRSFQLVDSELFDKTQNQCEEIYKDILVNRLDYKLSNFDPDKFVSIYSIDSMNGFEFEEFLSLLFRVLGYDVKETKKTGDQGADLFVEKFGKKIVIQAKNYSGNVGNSAVQQALSAKTFYSCDDAMVVTNSYFTKSAKELASASSVKLVDRNNLISYLDDFNQAQIEALEEA